MRAKAFGWKIPYLTASDILMTVLLSELVPYRRNTTSLTRYHGQVVGGGATTYRIFLFPKGNEHLIQWLVEL